MEAERSVIYITSTQPTHDRLLAAMGLSTCAVALLLASFGSLFNFAASDAKPGSPHDHLLIVHLRNRERGHGIKIATGHSAVGSFLPEQPVDAVLHKPPPGRKPIGLPEGPSVAEPVKDWRAIANEGAKTSVAEFFRQEELRTSTWRRNRSIMFRPANDIKRTEKKPLLANVHFKHRSRVFGLGINLGSCFIGLPVAGIPVERRSIGITVFYCGQDS